MEQAFPLGYFLHVNIHLPCATTLYMYVFSGDGFFLCLRISLPYNLTFERYCSTPAWLQVDP